MGSIGRTLAVWALASGCLSTPPDGPTPGGICGTLSALTDDFEGGIDEWIWYPEGLWGADSGAVQLTPSAETVSGLYSRQAWMVEGGQLEIGFDVSAMAPDSWLGVTLSGVDASVTLALEDGALRANVFQDGFEGTRDSITFDPDAMWWWRIGRAGGRMQWATSMDGEIWAEVGEFDADLSGPAEVLIEHFAQGNASVVTVDGVNPGGTGESACPADGFRDDFSASSPRWAIVAEELCDVRIDQRAELGVSAPDACGLISRERFSLADTGVSVELAEAGDCHLNPSLQVHFNAMRAEIGCRAASPPILMAAAYGDEWGEEFATADFDPLEHRFLRIRHEAGAGGLVFETSPDRVEWSRLGLWDDLGGVDLTSVAVGLLIYTDDPNDEVIAFDELNTAP